MLAQYGALPQSKIRTALGRARRAWWGAAALRIFLGSMAAAGIAVVVAWCWAWLAGDAGRLIDNAPSASRLAAVAGSAMILAGILMTLWHALTSPSLLELARRLDHGAKQRQAFSTAWEVLAGQGPRSVVESRLLATVEEASQDVEVRSARGAGGPWGLAAVSALVLASVAIAVPVPGRVVGDVTTAQRQPADLTWTEEELATLAGVAELLDLAAQRADDQYLRAVASSFADLAADVESGTISAAEAERSLEDLMSHLSEAARQAGGPLAAAVERALSSVPASAAGRLSADTSGSETSSSAVTEALPDAASSDTAQATADPSASYYMALRNLVDELGGEEAGRGVRSGQPGAGEGAMDDSFYGGVLRAETDPNAAAPAGPRVQAEGGGDAAGAAQKSSEGAGDAAGAGGAALFDIFDPLAPVQAEIGTEALLPRNESDEGQYVEIEMIPQAGGSTAEDGDHDVTVPAFVRAAESASATRGLGPEHLDVVSRYFTPESNAGGP